MNIQVLVAAMHQTDHSLIDKMRITTDAIVGNQCDRNSVEHFEHNGCKITYLNFAERGVGLNRNNTLMRATADICIFSDDDIEYYDNYAKVIEDAFIANPKADVIVFNVVEAVPTRKIITKAGRVNYLNFLRYGTPKVAIKLNKVKFNGIYFNQCFGGGTEYCHGEDNLFLAECLKHKLKIYAIPNAIARYTDERPSTWNQGYNEKYLRDQGRLFLALSRKWWRLLCLQDVLRRHKSYNMSWIKAYRIMTNG